MKPGVGSGLMKRPVVLPGGDSLQVLCGGDDLKQFFLCLKPSSLQLKWECEVLVILI